MKLAERDILKRLGRGESIQAVCAAAGLKRDEFHSWWQQTIAARVSPESGRSVAAVRAQVVIERDRWGVPHLYAENDDDLYFGFGYAMAQDRLFQLDYLRRKGQGRLAEILGEDGLQQDVIARTVGLNRIAAAEWDRLAPAVQHLLEAFSSGINAVIAQLGKRVPIEFDLLDYRPEGWSPLDCLAIESEFRWYLTGRFPVIAIPELARRTLGDGSLYQEMLLGEADQESIIHPGEFSPTSSEEMAPPELVGQVTGDPEESVGSNNWVIAGDRATAGMPLIGSDPHIAFEAVSCWYEAHLCGGSFHVAGMAYVGIPAIMFGRNERVAWGITNNICSQRDLYQEKVDSEDAAAFLFDDRPEKARELTEVIRVRDSDTVTKTIRFSRNGPVVDEILPPPSNRMGPVTLKWLGAYQGGWLTSMLAMDRAGSVEEFREALRPWHVPTFSLVIADVEGTIGFQSAGRIPIRKQAERGFRPGWDPHHQWQGLIPFEAMPRLTNPSRGWIGTANNRLAPDDFPYPLFGCWSSGWRAIRIRQMIESMEKLSVDDMGRMHQDTKSLRAEALVPRLIDNLQAADDPQLQTVIDLLRSWDYCIDELSVPATVFNVFFTHWCRHVAAQRFDSDSTDLVAGALNGLAGRLLHADSTGWFESGDRQDRVVTVMRETMRYLEDRLGADTSTWHWGKLHQLTRRHVLSFRGDLGELLSVADVPVQGDMVTVCNTGCGLDWRATTGAGYRLVVDLSDKPPRLWAVDAQSQSGHPGSAHFDDQLEKWKGGQYREIVLSREPSASDPDQQLVLVPS